MAQASNVVPFRPPVSESLPAHALDAEAAVVSACVLQPGTYELVSGYLRPEHFFLALHSEMFRHVGALVDEGKAVDVVTVVQRMRAPEPLTAKEIAEGKAPNPDKPIRMPDVMRVVDGSPSVANVEDHAKLVFDAWRLREAAAKADRVAAFCRGHVANPQEVLDRAEASFAEIAQNQPHKRAGTSMDATIRETFTKIQSVCNGTAALGTQTGFGALDEMTAGMMPGDLWVLGARSGMGKTSLATAIAVGVASAGDGVLFFSIEMPRDQIATRIVCAESRVPLSSVRRGALLPADWAQITEAAQWLSQLPVDFDDTPAIACHEVRAGAKRTQRRMATRGVKLGLIVVDYLQLMTAPTSKNSTRELEVAYMARHLKATAKALGVPVLALSQINVDRDRPDKRPGPHDLRESKAIWHESDTILFLHHDGASRRDIVELIVAKQRNGPTGSMPIRWDGPTTRFYNPEPGDSLPNSEPRGQR